MSSSLSLRLSTSNLLFYNLIATMDTTNEPGDVLLSGAIKMPFLLFPWRWSILFTWNSLPGFNFCLYTRPPTTRPAHHIINRNFPCSSITIHLFALRADVEATHQKVPFCYEGFPWQFSMSHCAFAFFCGGANGRGKWFLNSGKVIWVGAGGKRWIHKLCNWNFKQLRKLLTWPNWPITPINLSNF